MFQLLDHPELYYARQAGYISQCKIVVMALTRTTKDARLLLYEEDGGRKESPMSTSQIADLSDEDLVALARQGQYGCILQYYRFKAGWKARELAQLYAEAIRADGEEQPISP